MTIFLLNSFLPAQLAAAPQDAGKIQVTTKTAPSETAACQLRHVRFVSWNFLQQTKAIVIPTLTEEICRQVSPVLSLVDFTITYLDTVC